MPGVGADSQVAPEVLVRRFGTSTLIAPAASTNRYGFSRITGVVATVVYGGLGKLCAGAPCTPTKTLFQTAFWLLPMLESRVNHCCWENGCSAPMIRLSAM